MIYPPDDLEPLEIDAMLKQDLPEATKKHFDQIDHGVLLEQIALLRDLLDGKNHWVTKLLEQERDRNQLLAKENQELRLQREKLRLALLEAIIIADCGNDASQNDKERWRDLLP